MNIYKITNIETGLSYIGKDQRDCEYYMGSGLLLWNSYRKRFGREDLDDSKKSHHKWIYEQNKILGYYEKTILCECDDAKELCVLEKKYISEYNTIRPNGYNIAEGGEGGVLIAGYTEEEKDEWRRKISEATKEAMARPDVRENFMNYIASRGDEWKQHISESLIGHKGHQQSEETKEKLRKINLGNQYGLGNKSRTGYKNSEEMNRRISEGAKKVKHTDKWNANVSKALKGRQLSEEHKQAMRKPKPKYKWLLPDGTIKIMSGSGGSRHKDWIKLEKIENTNSDQISND